MAGLVSCPIHTRKGSGNIVHKELSLAQECGVSNQIAQALRNVLFTRGLMKFVFVFILKVEWMASLVDLVPPKGRNERQ